MATAIPSSYGHIWQPRTFLLDLSTHFEFECIHVPTWYVMNISLNLENALSLKRTFIMWKTLFSFVQYIIKMMTVSEIVVSNFVN